MNKKKIAVATIALVLIVGSVSYHTHRSSVEEKAARDKNIVEGIRKITDSAMAAAREKYLALSPEAKAKFEVEGRHEAELNFAKSRAQSQRRINDLMLLFGDRVPFSKTCYQAAISNYIDDKWNESMADFGCNSIDTFCKKLDGPKDMEKLSATLDMMGRDIHNEKDRAIGIALSNVWSISSSFYLRINKLSFQLDSTGKERLFKKEVREIPDDEKKKMVGDFDKYINSCASRKPSDWSVPKRSLAASTNTDLPVNAIKIGALDMLFQSLIANHLPDNEKRDAACLMSLPPKDPPKTEDVPANKKARLSARLQDYKATNCDLGLMPK